MKAEDTKILEAVIRKRTVNTTANDLQTTQKTKS
jgi:hypothetical protein